VLDLAWKPIVPPRPLTTAAGRTAVTVAAIVAIATIIGIGGALGGEFVDRFIGDTALQQITTYPANMIKPLDRPDATQMRLPFQPTVLPGKTILHYEPGGRIDVHIARFQELAQRGGEIEITDYCNSACTLVLGYVPLDRICFGKDARLNFHKASNPDGTPSLEITLQMISHYPANIQAFIQKRGGASQLPHREGWWTLTAPELWKMGYRKCDG
jgi:hypothetical protein